MNRTFDALGGWHGASAILTDGAEPEQVDAARVTSGFFRALGVQPVAGRLFIADDDVAVEATRPCCCRTGCGMRRYGGDPGIVGRPIILGSGPRTVIGVLAGRHTVARPGRVVLPMVRRTDADRGSFEYTAVGRLKPGVSLDAARADLQVVSKNLERLYPATNTGLGVAIGSSRDWIANDDLRRTLWILLGAVGLLLLIACVNVTNLLLSPGGSEGARERRADGARRDAQGSGARVADGVGDPEHRRHRPRLDSPKVCWRVMQAAAPVTCRGSARSRSMARCLAWRARSPSVWASAPALFPPSRRRSTTSCRRSATASAAWRAIFVRRGCAISSSAPKSRCRCCC